ncbi:MAG: hypothetical protein WC841_05935 [Candidatus Shapirobacteria bacterium]|jgi:hypothetical protein
MRHRKLLTTIALALVSSLMLAGCSAKAEVVDKAVDYKQETPTLTETPEQSEIPDLIPTTGITTKETEDQKLIDELNQFQDGSLEADFLEIEAQL